MLISLGIAVAGEQQKHQERYNMLRNMVCHTRNVSFSKSRLYAGLALKRDRYCWVSTKLGYQISAVHISVVACPVCNSYHFYDIALSDAAFLLSRTFYLCTWWIFTVIVRLIIELAQMLLLHECCCTNVVEQMELLLSFSLNLVWMT